jgi:tRNA (guanosine-2'-O-)-methyltransferase
LKTRREKLIEAYYQNKLQGFELLIDNVGDPHNVTAVARSSDGLGVGRINLYYTQNVFPSLDMEGKRPGCGAHKWLDFNRVSDICVFAEQKKQEGFVFIGTRPPDGSDNLLDFIFPEKSVIVLGAEHSGMSPEVESVCDRFIHIPMVGLAESYNISVAAAIIMYEAFRQLGGHLDQSICRSLRGERD